MFLKQCDKVCDCYFEKEFLTRCVSYSEKY